MGIWPPFISRPKSFKADLEIGSVAENLIIQKLSTCGITCTPVQKKLRKFYDLQCESPLLSSFFIECKYDVRAASTGNLAIEYFNSKTQEPTGIGITTADFWAQILSQDELYLVSVPNLKSFIGQTKPTRTVIGAGDGNADILLYKKEDILPIFTNIARLSPDQLIGFFSEKYK